MLMQWCHGAPGVVTALTDYPAGHSAAMDAMLIGAGGAIWKARPLVKGYGLCHHTAGNGTAFLALCRCTQDALWLVRARAFAMPAIAQREHMRRGYGCGRHTLWTGDDDHAVYLWHRLKGNAALRGPEDIID